MRLIAIANHKGGSGKTTTAVNLAATLAGAEAGGVNLTTTLAEAEAGSGRRASTGRGP